MRFFKTKLKADFQGWNAAISQTPNLVKNAEVTFDCCGSGLKKDDNGALVTYRNPNDLDKKWSEDNKVNFGQDAKCFNHTSVECLTCYTKIEEKVGKGFRTAGGLGLFFSFPEVRLFFN